MVPHELIATGWNLYVLVLQEIIIIRTDSESIQCTTLMQSGINSPTLFLYDEP